MAAGVRFKQTGVLSADFVTRNTSMAWMELLSKFSPPQLWEKAVRAGHNWDGEKQALDKAR